MVRIFGFDLRLVNLRDEEAKHAVLVEMEELEKNPYDRPTMRTEKGKMANMIMDHCRLFVPYNLFTPKQRNKNELGRLFGCCIVCEGV
ncbi:hypothetical protein HQ529_03630 [Candidatus Woesearchaeota archaeon]|nr:hypothetical protein [Candidatus Woesearchaeota archaeon]